MERTPVKKAPNLVLGGWPAWWSAKGLKMVLTGSDPRGQIIIESKAAKLELLRDIHQRGWNVHWRIEGPSSVSGRVWMSDEQVAGAFGLQDAVEIWEGNAWFLERYGADSVSPAVYIRYQNFLNIPCPGTGYAGDPNISIELDDRMKEAVRSFLGEQYAQATGE